jgi:NAD+ synthase
MIAMRNKSPINWHQTALLIDPSEAIEEIIRLIQDCFKSLNRRLAVVGLSGGLDSSLTASLTVKSLGIDRVQLYYLPDRDSKSIHRQHAELLAEQLGLDLQQLNISPALRSLRVYKLLPLRFFPTQKLKTRAVEYGREKFLQNAKGEVLSLRLSATGGRWLARANAYISAKHRMRMIALYLAAERQSGMVVGAANRTEWMTGTFTHWGCDHCADVMPLLHLYRSQLIPLAKYLNIPEEIRTKKADPDLLPGLDDKGELLGSFENTDLILWALENDIPREELVSEFSEEQVTYIQTLVEESSIYRDAPFTLL